MVQPIAQQKASKEKTCKNFKQWSLNDFQKRGIMHNVIVHPFMEE